MRRIVLSVLLGVGLLASSVALAADDWAVADAACAPGCAAVGPDGYPTYFAEHYGCVSGALVAATPRDKLTPKLRREFAARYGVKYTGVRRDRPRVAQPATGRQ